MPDNTQPDTTLIRKEIMKLLEGLNVQYAKEMLQRIIGTLDYNSIVKGDS